MPERRPRVRMDRGLRGAEANCAGAALAVVADVLSFTTTLSVAIDLGAEVYPFEWQDTSRGVPVLSSERFVNAG